MTSNLYWTPIARVDERRDLDTWRPSSFISRVVERFGNGPRFILETDDLEWLREVAEDMGVDGGGHSEAGQLIIALETHGRVLLEIEG